MGWVYVTGGRQRKHAVGKPEWKQYGCGIVLRIDAETGASEVCTEYVSPPEVCPATHSSMLFKAGTVWNGALYVCTHTEVLVYDLASFDCTAYLSLPWFNDLHHVIPSSRDTFLVVNTGLDMVLETTLQGEVLRHWSAASGDVWDRFSKEEDYRKVVTTKPHAAHPNYVFCIEGAVWVTRFEQRDAICLTQQGRRIAVDVERPHDGVVDGNELYFTTVDGRVVVADWKALQVVDVLDLNQISGTGQPLGWCRGLRVDGDRAWVGFSRLRPTRFRENLSWMKHGFKKVGQYGTMPTRVACYDLKRRQLVGEVEVEGYGINTVFGVL